MKNRAKNYTLRKISRKECERRGLNVYKLSNCPMLIATKAVMKEYKKRDSTTWGHLFVADKNFGVCLKKYKRYDSAYIICEKPKTIKLEVKRFGKNIYTGEETNDVYRSVNGQSTFKHYSINGIVRSNKAIFGHIIGTFIS